jgi:hypothetical protein
VAARPRNGNRFNGGKESPPANAIESIFSAFLLKKDIYRSHKKTRRDRKDHAALVCSALGKTYRANGR